MSVERKFFHVKMLNKSAAPNSHQFTPISPSMYILNNIDLTSF